MTLHLVFVGFAVNECVLLDMVCAGLQVSPCRLCMPVYTCVRRRNGACLYTPGTAAVAAGVSHPNRGREAAAASHILLNRSY